MGCCGQKSGQRLKYEVKLNGGATITVDSVAEAKIKIATGGGGTYRAIAAPAGK